MSTISRLTTIALVAAFSAACSSTAGYDHQYTNVGMATGAVIGGVLGHQIHGKNGRYAGAAAGALIGGMTGYNADQISAVRRGHGIQGYMPSQEPQPPSYYQPSHYYQQPSTPPPGHRYSNIGYAPYPR